MKKKQTIMLSLSLMRKEIPSYLDYLAKHRLVYDREMIWLVLRDFIHYLEEKYSGEKKKI